MKKNETTEETYIRRENYIRKAGWVQCENLIDWRDPRTGVVLPVLSAYTNQSAYWVQRMREEDSS